MLSDYYLDTNIIFGYIITHDRIHPECCIIFEMPNIKFTCISVKQELDDILQRGKSAYEEVIKKTNGKEIAITNLDFSSRWKQNFIESAFDKLPMSTNHIKYLRLLILEAEQRKIDAFQKISMPLVQKCDDDSLADDLNCECDIDIGDDMILCNYCVSSMTRTYTIFITDDGKIWKNKESIINFFQRKGFTRTKLSISSIHNIIHPDT